MNGNTEYTTNFWKNTFIFSNASEDEIESLLQIITVEKKEYACGEIIYSPESFEKKVGFVITGECVVERMRNEGENLPLNTLKFGDSFGIMTLFSYEEHFPTLVRSKKPSEIAFITKNDVLKLIEKSSLISINIINFMSGRISFLNDKISTFSSDTVEQKFANYLLNEAKSINSFCFVLNRKKTAETINIGRASLYRAIETFEKEGLIKFENKKIYITDPCGLERISK